MSRFRVLTLALILATALFTAPAFSASDLWVEVYGVHFVTDATVSPGEVYEGCAGATSGRTLLRFGTKVHNLGPDNLVLGDPGCPDCSTHPGAACQNPDFVCGTGLYRAHFRSAASYELLDLAGNVVASGPKRGYCFGDDACDPGVTPNFTSCNNQGLTVGCVDDYTDADPCQYIDATNVPNATTRAFTLRVTIDTQHLLPDPNRANNVTTVALPGCGDGVVQSGEQCDAGPSSSACCDATCHLLPAGTVCRPATSACDAAETCDGKSASCPADATMPDGTVCGSGVPPCVDARCQAGQCERTQQPATCAIAGTCFANGTVDPADACEACDASAAPDAWTPNRGSDPQGIACQLSRVSHAVEALPCGRRVQRSIAAPMRQLRRLLARQTAASAKGKGPSGALVRVAQRLSDTITRTARRSRCDARAAAGEASLLLGQVRGFAGGSAVENEAGQPRALLRAFVTP